MCLLSDENDFQRAAHLPAADESRSEASAAEEESRSNGHHVTDHTCPGVTITWVYLPTLSKRGKDVYISFFLKCGQIKMKRCQKRLTRKKEIKSRIPRSVIRLSVSHRDHAAVQKAKMNGKVQIKKCIFLDR